MRIAIFLIILLLIPTVSVLADEDEFEEGELEERKEGRKIFGEEREEEDEEGERNLGGFANIVLYATIAAVAGTGGYVLWKIAKMKVKA
jgi:hypothetical protein